MITLDTLYRLVEHYTSKHYSGQTLTPELFTIVLGRENTELFYNVFKEVKTVMEQKNKSLSEAVSLIGGLEPFIKYKNNAAVESSTGKLDLEEDYYYYDAFYLLMGGLNRAVEVVTEKDAQLLKTNMIARNLRERPICVIDSKTTARFTPTQPKASPCNYSYIKLPSAPYYDYCIDNSNNTKVYMPVGSKISDADGNGVWDLVDSEDALLTSNVTHLLSPNQAYTSLTVELEWKETEIITILKNILIGEGISLKDGELFSMVKADEK